MAGTSPGWRREPLPDPAEARTPKEFGTALRRMRERCAKLAVDRMRDPGSSECWKELRREFIQAVECGFHQAESDDEIHDFLRCFIRVCLRGLPEEEVTAEVVRWQNAWRQLARIPAPDIPPGTPREVPSPTMRSPPAQSEPGVPPNTRDLRLDEPEPDITPTDIDPTEPAF